MLLVNIFTMSPTKQKVADVVHSTPVIFLPESTMHSMSYGIH